MKQLLISLFVLLLMIIPGSSKLRGGQAGSNSRKTVPVTRLRTCLAPCSFTSNSGLGDPLRVVIRDQEAWHDMWKRIHSTVVVGLPPLPEIDFAREMVVVVALGARPTGGYGVIVDGAYERDDRLEVIVSVQSPGKSCMLTQAVTQPVDIVRIPKTNRSVVFKDKENVHECDQKRKPAVTPSSVTRAWRDDSSRK